MICLVDSINMKKVARRKHVYWKLRVANQPWNFERQNFFLLRMWSLRNLFYLFYIKILHGKREERLTRHMRNNEVLQNIYFFTTNFIIISCKHYALSILSIHGRQAPAYCLQVEPNSVFG